VHQSASLLCVCVCFVLLRLPTVLQRVVRKIPLQRCVVVVFPMLIVCSLLFVRLFIPQATDSYPFPLYSCHARAHTHKRTHYLSPLLSIGPLSNTIDFLSARTTTENRSAHLEPVRVLPLSLHASHSLPGNATAWCAPLPRCGRSDNASSLQFWPASLRAFYARGNVDSVVSFHGP
jgi:hypothetical protein